MNNMTFGQLLEKMLYLSNQKKGALANSLGYDDSYISKWISSKNLPTSKNISKISKNIADFVVSSMTESAKEDFIVYFEINIDVNDEELLKKYIERSLKEAYFDTARQNAQVVHKGTHSEDNYNSIVHVNPRLRKKYLSKDATSFMSKSKNIDLIICANLYNLNDDDKMAIANMKSDLAEISDIEELRVRLLMGISHEDEDIVFNTLLLINMVCMNPYLDFEIYNCEFDTRTVLAVLKDRLFHSAIYSKDKRCLFTSMSKEKSTVDEMYYSLDDISKNQGKLIFDKETPTELIKDKSYIQYIMGQNLRCLIGSINELFMPEDLFMEIGIDVFGDDEETINELKKINLFLQNGTYKSNIKVLIYEAELRRYISTGSLFFFNNQVTLTFKQRERHIKYIEKILKELENIEIRVVEGNFVEDFKNNANPSLYLSKNLKFTKVYPTENINDYLVIKDNEFKNVCDRLYDILWNDRKDIVVDDKNDIIEKITNALNYTKIINENAENLLI